MKVYSLLTLHEVSRIIVNSDSFDLAVCTELHALLRTKRQVGWGTRALGQAAASEPAPSLQAISHSPDSKSFYTRDEEEKKAYHYSPEKGSSRTRSLRSKATVSRKPAPRYTASTLEYEHDLKSSYEPEPAYGQRRASGGSSMYEKEQYHTQHEHQQHQDNSRSSHYIIKDDDEMQHRHDEIEEAEEEDGYRHGLHIYHDYLPQLRKTPDLENAKQSKSRSKSKPIIRMR
jgi:hypothetical protein